MKHFILLCCLATLIVSCTPMTEISIYASMDYTLREPNLSFTNLASLHSWMEYNLSYDSDDNVYGEREHWAMPQEFIDKRRGDCDDYAIFVMYFADKMGYNVEFIGYDTGDCGHAIVKLNNAYYDAQRMVLVARPKEDTIWYELSLDEVLAVAYNRDGSRYITTGVIK